MTTEADPTSTRLTVAILAVDALVLLALYVSISVTSSPAAPPPGTATDGTPRGVESVFWLLLVPIGAALVAMAVVGIRELIALREERHEFERRPPEEQRRLHNVGSALHGVSAGAPPVSDRLAARKR